MYRFGRQAGLCYAAVQGGPFSSPQVEMLVERIRSFGVSGVGQSSWGPTIYAICRDQADARWLIDRLQAESLLDECDVTVTAPRNCGATVT